MEIRAFLLVGKTRSLMILNAIFWQYFLFLLNLELYPSALHMISRKKMYKKYSLYSSILWVSTMVWIGPACLCCLLSCHVNNNGVSKVGGEGVASCHWSLLCLVSNVLLEWWNSLFLTLHILIAKPLQFSVQRWLKTSPLSEGTKKRILVFGT